MARYTHTFAISAYKESEYLVDCIKSLQAQTRKSKILLATSTPSAFLEDIAKQFDIPLFVGSHQSGIGRDWNFAYDCADTDFVTIAHQDDVYLPEYTEALLGKVEQTKNPTLAFTEYSELRNGEIVSNNTLLRIKRLMNLGFIPGFLAKSRFVRDRILSLGSPISTPSAAYNKTRFPDLEFDLRMGTNLDWDMWQRMSAEQGTFVYVPKRLVLHRVHPDSETSAGIKGGYRPAEDLEMFMRFWPVPVARWLAKRYAKSYDSNA